MLTIDLREVLSHADVDGRVLAPRPGCNSQSDLENWVVGDASGAECILGQLHTFRRRAALGTSDPCLLDKAFNMTVPEGNEVRTFACAHLPAHTGLRTCLHVHLLACAQS